MLSGLCTLLIYICFQGHVEKLISHFQGKHAAHFYIAGINSARDFYAIGVDVDGNELLRYKSETNDGRNELLTKYNLNENFRPQDIMVTRSGDLFIGGVDTSLAEIYFLQKDSQTAVRLISQKVRTDYHSTFSHIIEDESGYSFMYFDDNANMLYTYDLENQNLTMDRTYSKTLNQPDSVPLAVSPSGKEYFLKDVDPNGLINESSLQFHNGIEVWVNRSGIWYMDKNSAEIYCTSERGSTGIVENLTNSKFGNVLEYTVSDAGMTFITDRGEILLKSSPVNTVRLGYYLNKRSFNARVVLLLYAAGLIFLNPLLYIALERNRKSGQSFVFREGAITSVTILFLMLVVSLAVIRGKVHQLEDDWMFTELSHIVHEDAQDPMLYTSEHLSELASGNMHSTSIRHYIRIGDQLYYKKREKQIESISAQGRTDTYIETIRKAFDEGEGRSVFYQNGRKRYAYAERIGQGVTCVTCLSESAEFVDWVFTIQRMLLILLAGVVSVISVFLLLNLISIRIRTLTESTIRMLEGKNVAMPDLRSDELGGLALAMSAAAEDRKLMKAEAEAMQTGYSRLLPENFYRVLGRNDIKGIVPGVHARRNVLYMNVIIHADILSEVDTEECFNYYQDVINRIAVQLNHFGGTVLSFSRDGMKVVFTENYAQGIQAAVAIKQAINIMNQALKGDARKELRVFVTLETLDVVIGIVGTDHRLQLFHAENSFSERLKLKGFANVLSDTILCTEEIIRTHPDVKNRFVGSLIDTDARYYEIYEGDVYAVLSQKDQYKATFEAGMDAFVSGDFHSAGRSFFQIIHQNEQDEMARLLMAIAEQKEKET